MSKVLNIISHSEAETFELGKKLAVMLKDPNLAVLTGELGSGKTVFIKGLAEGLGIRPEKVHSPTFNVVHEYHGETNLYHFDLYRLASTKELREIGWDDYLGRDGLVAVEWGDKAAGLLPEKYYLIEFKIAGENEREIKVSLKNK
ncbi:MAG: tRNA (adenosine(37)-N6)-threonylcarbamoyltransferase complex ATPase subunit type 1 TsaE [Candidatus Zixiibacteriota bacterium]